MDNDRITATEIVERWQKALDDAWSDLLVEKATGGIDSVPGAACKFAILEWFCRAWGPYNLLK